MNSKTLTTITLVVGLFGTLGFSQAHALAAPVEPIIYTDPVAYSWAGQCDGVIDTDTQKIIPGECADQAYAEIVFDNYTIETIEGVEVFTPLSFSSFTYYDNDPLFVDKYADTPVTWFYDYVSLLALEGSLYNSSSPESAYTGFTLSFVTYDTESENPSTITFYSYANGIWGFTSESTILGDKAEFLDAARGNGVDGTFAKVPEPESIALLALGLLGLMWSRRTQKIVTPA